MKSNKKKLCKRIAKRAVSFVLAFSLLTSSAPISDLIGGKGLFSFLKANNTVYAVDTNPFTFENGASEYDSSSEIVITNVNDLMRFSWWYNTYADSESLGSQYFVLNIQIADNNNDIGTNSDTGTYINLFDYSEDGITYGYKSLGTSSNPFYGNFKITGTNIDRFYSPTPLFDFIDQRSETSDANGVVRNLKFISATRSGDSASNGLPIFANNIVNPSNSNTPFSCDVTLEFFTYAENEDDSAAKRDFSGIVGTIGTTSQNASANISVTNNSQADVASSNSAGLICGTLNQQSALTATINDGTRTNYSVSSSGGNAGGIVGTMNANSKLVLDGSYYSDVTQSVSTTGDNTYAGGIVGYAIDADVVGVSSAYTANTSEVTNDYKTANTTVNGKEGSGYVFGYYLNTEDSKTFSLTWNQTATNLAATIELQSSNSGGLFGVLRNESSNSTIVINGGKTVSASTVSALKADGSATTMNVKVSDTSGLFQQGGLIGLYYANNLKSTLEIYNCSIRYGGNGDIDSAGGIIGRIAKEGSDTYVNIHDVYVRKGDSQSRGGGLVGAAGEGTGTGAFIDVSGYIKIHGQFSGGIVRNFQKGVLRLSGITDVSDQTGGNQIVNTRDSALVYATGTGADSNWKIIRRTAASNGIYGRVANDIGTWGEVLRLQGVVDETSTYDSTSEDYHKVSIAGISSELSNIDSLSDFALLALNIQHNTSATCGVLKMSSAAADKSSALLGSTSEITLANTTFNLSGTGITGLTRDCNNTTYQSDVFKGKLTGTASGTTKTKISLAIGEAYGVSDSSSTTHLTNSNSNNNGYGKIYGHGYNGLFARTQNASVSNLTVDGTAWLGINGEAMYFGGVSAQSSGGDSFDSITSDVTVNISRHSNHRTMSGGFIGRTATNASGTLLFTSCATTANFNDNTKNDDDKSESYFGGYIGTVDGVDNKANTGIVTVTFGSIGTNDAGTDTCAVGGSYTTDNSEASRYAIYGGLIGAIRGNSDHTVKRTVNIYSVSVDDLTINAKSNTATGGLLGYAWYDADVNINKLTVGATTTNTVTLSGGTGTALTGLVYAATGHWVVDKVNFNKVSFVTLNASSSLGMLVNIGINSCELNIDGTYSDDKKAALYLDLIGKSNYIINSSSSDISIDSNVSAFDEIVAYSKNPDKSSIADSGHAIVSIETSYEVEGENSAKTTVNAVVMDGTNGNTYENQSYYGTNTAKTNPNTRYYYNLKTIREKASKEDAEKVLLWSVYQYAHGTAVKDYFKNTVSGFSNISGNLDMAGLSYYAIDYPTGTSFGNITNLKFYNSEIEAGETTNSTDRITTSETTQHYLMHCGLFRNMKADSADISVTLGNLKLSGNVGRPVIAGNASSGFLVCGQFGDTDYNTSLKNNSSTIELDYAYVNGATSSNYAPLIIANVGKNSTIAINGVSSKNYTAHQTSGWYAASSLVGAVGADDGSSGNMKIDFSNIALDSRVTGTMPSVSDVTRFNEVYGSTRSIFSKATLLYHYIYTDSASIGHYNYTHDDDWGISGGKVKHNVTYGQEISETIDHRETINSVSVSQQRNYLNSNYFTDPSNGSNSITPYTFASASFLPYVGDYAVSGDKYHELRVNISTPNLDEGCGTYNDPYILNAKSLSAVASLMNSNSFSDTTFVINLPSTESDKITNANADLLWCSDKETENDEDGSNYHYKFSWNGSKFASTGTSTTYELVDVRKYLAGAYYMIDDDISMSSFSGLGAGGTSDYAFRGVIVGKKDEDGNVPTISIGGNSQFIVASNGCVVKDLTIEYTGAITVNGPSSSSTQFDYGNNGCGSFGGVISKIMGGDNIIDNVGVDYSNAKLGLGTGITQLSPVGGYVGVIVNGGLFFRNMSGDNSNVSTANRKGFDPETFANADEDATTYLYYNPIIGRVINGYAVTENGSSNTYGSDITMSNGTKNYSIADVNTNKAKLSVSGTAITVPSDQAWFIMSCIINSGSCQTKSASNISYDGSYKMTHHGKYDKVGTDLAQNAIGDDYTALFSSNSISEVGGTPWIISNYVSGDLPDLSSGGYSITMSGTPWSLPKGYKGIGNVYTENSGLNMSVSSITGGSTVINLDMKHQSYQYYNKAHEDNYTLQNSGFGLFNEFKPTGNATAQNFTLKGKVYVASYDKSNGRIRYRFASGANDNAQVVTSDNHDRLHVGMFAGLKSDTTNKLTVTNVSLVDVDVSGNRCAGGMIGKAANVSLNSCGGTNIKVFGQHDTGGLIGYASDGSEIIGNTTSKTTMTIDTVTEKGYGFKFQTAGRMAGVGGIIGRAKGTFSVKNMILSQATGKTGTVKLDNNVHNLTNLDTADNNTDTSSYAGGIYGGNDGGTVTIENCIINSINVEGTSGKTGGIAGGTNNTNHDGTVGVLTIRNVTMNGTSGISKLSSTRQHNVGGAVGSVNEVVIDGVYINNYILEKNYNDNADSSNPNNVGGLIGHLIKSANVKNVNISNCTFSGVAQNARFSGLIGKMAKNSTFKGYDITLNTLTDTTTGTSAGSKYTGDILARREDTSPIIQIVGFSRQSTPIKTIYGETINNSSYIIFSDYNGSFATNTKNSTTLPKIGGTEITDFVSVASPYANINPAYQVDTDNFYTGDGISATVSGLAINNIKTDIGGSSNKQYSVSAAKTTFEARNPSFTLFKADEWTTDASSMTNDFAVLLLEDSNRTNSTNLINSYLKLLTNYDKEYASVNNASDTICTVNIYKMQLVNGKFVKSSDPANLKRSYSDGKFYMLNDSPDTAEVDSSGNPLPTFSLIDVAFKDPTSSDGTIAYHLYVPVYVKKMLKFDFNIATGSNTPYESNWYSTNNRYGAMLMDNLGTPGTIYFTYTYKRTRKEWQDALDYGENFLTNYDKVLSMTKIGSTTTNFEDNTLVTLVDKNNKDKTYYARFGGTNGVYNSTDSQLTMYNSSGSTKSKFKTSLENSGTQFSPVPINDFLKITATPNNSGGKFVIVQNTSDATEMAKATVKIGDDYYRFYEDSDGNTIARYNLTVLNLADSSTADTSITDSTPLNVTESYYMSFFTIGESGYKFNYYGITSSSRLSGGGAAAKSDSTPQTASILFGNLFEQSDVTVQANPDGDNPDEINATNNTVKVELKTTVTISASANSEVSGLVSNANIYQSFLVYLTRHDGGAGATKAILGSPSAQASIGISAVNGSVAPQTCAKSTTYANTGLNYVEAASKIDISDYIVSGNGALITADVEITYDTDAKRAAQFPGRVKTDETTKYADVSATSNIGFDANNTAISKNQSAASVTGTVMHYYIMSSDKPTLQYNALVGENGDAYGQLGINANDLDDPSLGKVDVKTEAIYDVSPIANEVSEYDKVEITFTLNQKLQGYYDQYETTPKVIATYMNGVCVPDIADTPTEQTATTYTFILPRSNLIADGDNNRMTIPIDFSVFTGTAVPFGETQSFEGKGLMYSNYKVTITAELLKTNASSESGYDRYTASKVDNYIVYTNSKVFGDYIK